LWLAKNYRMFFCVKNNVNQKKTRIIAKNFISVATFFIPGVGTLAGAGLRLAAALTKATTIGSKLPV